MTLDEKRAKLKEQKNDKIHNYIKNLCIATHTKKLKMQDFGTS
jgi:hypothetical protein